RRSGREWSGRAEDSMYRYDSFISSMFCTKAGNSPEAGLPPGRSAGCPSRDGRVRGKGAEGG
ncbi:MAG: hypothetical protein LIO63_02305, partial [Akkermansia sp.]|nr:hypothetical protein [Akkermansia sp.]